MATGLQECITKEQRSVVLYFCGQQDLRQRIFIKKCIFPVYGGKYLSCKAVYNWVEKLSQGRWKISDDARTCAKVAKTAAKRLLCCGFRRTGKAKGRVSMLVVDMSRNKCVFQIRILHVLRFIYICDVFTDFFSAFSSRSIAERASVFR
jgi:hypothetical protein